MALSFLKQILRLWVFHVLWTWQKKTSNQTVNILIETNWHVIKILKGYS